MPDAAKPLRPARQCRVPGTARQLKNHQAQELIASCLAGATVYEIGDDVPMRRRGLSSDPVDEAVRLYEAQPAPRRRLSRKFQEVPVSPGQPARPIEITDGAEIFDV